MSIIIWDMTNLNIKYQFKSAHSNAVYGLVELGNGGLASGSVDKVIRIWDVMSGTNTKNLTRDNSYEGFTLILRSNGDLVSGTLQAINFWNIY
jgi:WD40 repeat protein